MGKKKRDDVLIQDILLREKSERRLLPDVADVSGLRSNEDRRGSNFDSDDEGFEKKIDCRKSGIRYVSHYEVKLIVKGDFGTKVMHSLVKDISITGCMIQINDEEDILLLKKAKSIRVKFEIEKGSMPEGYEMKVNTLVKLVRTFRADREYQCGFLFEKDLSKYAKRKKDTYMLVVSSILLFFITLIIVFMRTESIIYFKFNKTLYLYSIITAVFLLSRYFFGALYRPVKIDTKFCPSVSIIIPCFNEEKWIQRTILSCTNQNYPPEKLEVIIVDDASSDRSVKRVKQIIKDLIEEEDEHSHVKDRISFYVQPDNAGKREALVLGVEHAKNELVVFVDSDSFLDPFAIRHLVQPFKDPHMGGVAGRTDVANTYTNILTKMQSVRYYIAFRIMKAAEGYFDCVTCLSGPLSCYRKELVEKNKQRWLDQSFLGQKATFGDDRAMTNMILEEYRTTYQDTAVCSTIVPNEYPVFLKQQMRWKRSWLRESLMAGKFIWKKEPFAALFFYIGLLVPVLAPIIFVYNLVYVPLAYQIFPKTFLLGILLMASMMSAAQLFLRKSSTWLFGLIFCLYYEAVLLWQMPIAVLTFWKSTWGTRMTKNDVKAAKKKENLLNRKSKKKAYREEKKENKHQKKRAKETIKKSKNKNEKVDKRQVGGASK